MFGLWSISFFALTVLIGVFLLGMAWKGDGARHLRRCRRCRYVVEATDVLTCPECGFQHRHHERMRFSARSGSALFRAILIGMIGIAGLAVPLLRAADPVSALSESALIRVWAFAQHVAPQTADRCARELWTRTFDADDTEFLARRLIGLWNDARTDNDDWPVEFLESLTVGEGGISPVGAQPLEPAGGDESDEARNYFAIAPDSLVAPLELAAYRLRGRDDTSPATFLAVMSRRSTTACRALIRLIADDPQARYIMMGRAGELMVATAAAVLEDERAPLAERIVCADVLFDLERLDSSVAPSILALLGRAAPDDRSKLASYLAAWSMDDERLRGLRNDIVAAVRADDTPRCEVLFAIADLFQGMELSVLEPLTQDLASPVSFVRARACAALVLGDPSRDIEAVVESVVDGPERSIMYDAFAIAHRRSASLERAAIDDLTSSDIRTADAATRFLKSLENDVDRLAVWTRLLSDSNPLRREYACERFIEETMPPDRRALDACLADTDRWVALAARRVVARHELKLQREIDIEDEVSARFRRLERRGENVSLLVNELLSSRDNRVRLAAINRLMPDAVGLRLDASTCVHVGREELTILLARLVREGGLRVASNMILDSMNQLNVNIESLRAAVTALTPDERESLQSAVARERGRQGESTAAALSMVFNVPEAP